MKIIFTGILLLLGLAFGHAQAKIYIDSVFLKDGKIITGQVVRFKNKVLIEQANDYWLAIPSKSVDRLIIHVGQKSSVNFTAKAKQNRLDRPYAFQEQGIYNVSYLSIINGLAYNTGDPQLGLGLQHTIGVQLKRGIGLGIGAGLDNYTVSDPNGGLVLPVFAEMRGYLAAKNWAPYYSVNLGYGFAFKDETVGITAARGGIMLHPAFGFRMGARNDMNFLFDLGYKFQQVTLTKVFNFWNFETQVQDIWYQRFSLRIGMIF